MDKNDKELADELDARDRLRNQGYQWVACESCKGIRFDYCAACSGKGGRWQAPMMRTMAESPRKGLWGKLKQWREDNRKTDNIVTRTSPELAAKLKSVSDRVNALYKTQPPTGEENE